MISRAGRGGAGRRTRRRLARRPAAFGRPDRRRDGDPELRGTSRHREDKDLLTFVASHVGSALTRARAIEETRQRSAELALINDVQRGLAERLDMQAMYDLVGDRIQEIFDAQVVDIGILDGRPVCIHFPYTIERAFASPTSRSSPSPASAGTCSRRASRSSSTRTRGAAGRAGIRQPRWLGRAAEVVLFVPLIVGGEATGVISLQNLDREHAFSEADVRLLTTLAGQPQRRARERAPVRRDPPAERRAGPHQRSSSRAWRRTSTCRRCTTWSATGPGDLRRPGGRHRHPRPSGGRSTSRTRSSAACASR